MPFLRWVRSKGRSPHASGKAKNTFDPVSNPLFGAPQAPGNKHTPPPDHVSSRVWCEPATNKQRSPRTFSEPMYGTRPCCLVQAINPAYVRGPTFGFVKLLASSGSHCTKLVDEQHRPAGFESRLVPDLPLLFIPTLIGLRAFDHVSSRIWWEAATNKEVPALF